MEKISMVRGSSVRIPHRWCGSLGKVSSTSALSGRPSNLGPGADDTCNLAGVSCEEVGGAVTDLLHVLHLVLCRTRAGIAQRNPPVVLHAQPGVGRTNGCRA
eukprot:scaffold2732_cov346-Pavlova_lutheri.AAC.5